MKNRTLILNDLNRMQEHNVSLEEMAYKLQHFSLCYYESLNILHEVTNKSLVEISNELLKEQYWQDMKAKTDEKENALNTEYSAILQNKEMKKQNFDKAIEESYNGVLDSNKQKENRLRNLDQTIMEIYK